MKKPMTLGYWLELRASALHPVAIIRRLVETRLLGMVLLSASTHGDEANTRRLLVVSPQMSRNEKQSCSPCQGNILQRFQLLDNEDTKR